MTNLNKFIDYNYEKLAKNEINSLKSIEDFMKVR